MTKCNQKTSGDHLFLIFMHIREGYPPIPKLLCDSPHLKGLRKYRLQKTESQKLTGQGDFGQKKIEKDNFLKKGENG